MWLLAYELRQVCKKRFEMCRNYNNRRLDWKGCKRWCEVQSLCWSLLHYVIQVIESWSKLMPQNILTSLSCMLLAWSMILVQKNWMVQPQREKGFIYMQKREKSGKNLFAIGWLVDACIIHLFILGDTHKINVPNCSIYIFWKWNYWLQRVVPILFILEIAFQKVFPISRNIRSPNRNLHQVSTEEQKV